MDEKNSWIFGEGDKFSPSGEPEHEKNKLASELMSPHMFPLQFGRRNKDVTAMALLDDIVMPLNESSRIDDEIHIHLLSFTNDIFTSDIPSNLIMLAHTILNPLDNNKGIRYPLRTRKKLEKLDFSI